MSGREKPTSTRAQIVTATSAVVCVVVAVVTALMAALLTYIAFQVVAAVSSNFEDTGAALAVPATETLCLNYAATVLELEAAGLGHDEITSVIDSAVPVEEVSPSELRELSLASQSVCGPVRDVLDAAGR